MSASANDGFMSMDMASSRGAGVVVGSSQGLFTDAGKVSDWRRRRSVACTSTLAQGLALGEQERGAGLGPWVFTLADRRRLPTGPQPQIFDQESPAATLAPTLFHPFCRTRPVAACLHVAVLCCLLLAAPPSARYPPNQHHSNCPHTTNTNPSKHGTPQTHNTLSAGLAHRALLNTPSSGRRPANCLSIHHRRGALIALTHVCRRIYT